MKKSTIILSAITLSLLALVGAGIWTLVSRSNNQRLEVRKVIPTGQQKKTFSMSEIAIHNSKNDCWTVISGDVYDLTKFINRHPGGDEILRACGTDATSLFNSRKTSDGQPVPSVLHT